MFTTNAQTLIESAKDIAYSSGSRELALSACLTAVSRSVEAGLLLTECLRIPTDRLAQACHPPDVISVCPGTLPLARSMQNMLEAARTLAGEVPDGVRPGLVNARHLVCALAMSDDVGAELHITPITRAEALKRLTAWSEQDEQTPDLGDLVDRLHEMRGVLLKKVFGQDHAVHAFVEALFNAEVVAAADKKRRQPTALFAFAGPPGVGKTYLAELGASYLDRPFKRFDMSSYAGPLECQSLTGMPKGYVGARTGTLTDFVLKNPSAILLFDEIEKASSQTIHLFLQILDAGVLQDAYLEQDVPFRDTMIILTTNAGRQLYDRPNESGVHTANASFHRRTILDALEHEVDSRTGQPFFPTAICSRMATGYPILFNHLRVNELEQVVRAELERVGGLLERQYYKRVRFDDLVALCLVLREGARTDARTLRSQAETFVKTQIFELCRLYESHRLEDVLAEIDHICFELDAGPAPLEPEVKMLFTAAAAPRVLLVADPYFCDLYAKRMPEIQWRCAETAADALQTLGQEEIDAVLLDIWLGRNEQAAGMTIEQFDHAPLAARALSQGQELLRSIHGRLPTMPVYLLSFAHKRGPRGQRKAVDDELLMACVRGGGARGMIVSRFTNDEAHGWEQSCREFSTGVLDICRVLYREKAAEKMGQERKVLAFDTAPRVDQKSRTVSVRLRNLRPARAIAAADAGELLDEVQRPATRFDDVIGADAAKEELRFFIDYLKEPRRFAALGLKPPKGVLLHGPPGTGKTMLARAMAGESSAAFIQLAAGSVQSKWLGESEKNIRDLFARARRYAPCIVFIDEIDSIGQPRGQGEASAHGSILNALLTEMDGFGGSAPDRPVFVLAATNFDVGEDDGGDPDGKGTLDAALLRRFSRKILIDLPDQAARLKYLRMRLDGRPACTITEDAINLVARRSAGMSIANLELIVETAARKAARAAGELTDEILLEALACHPISEDTARPSTTFDDVIGADAAKGELRFFLDYLKEPARFTALGLKPPKGILLYGPPGTGKTLLARAMAGESNAAFIPTVGTSLRSKYIGEGAKNIRQLFKRARRRAPAILFIDEIDAIGRIRTGAESSEELNALLTEMDGFLSPSPDKPVFVLAATNFDVEEDGTEDQQRNARRLDPALLRRFSRRILVDLPDRAARLKYLQVRLKGRPACVVTENIVNLVTERSVGMSLADLESVIETAARSAAKTTSELTDSLLEEALETVQFGETRARKPDEVKSTARHEAGHTILYWLSGWWPAYVTVVARGHHGGYMAHCSAQAEMRHKRTKGQLLADIRTCLGGRGAEILYYGEQDGLSTGAAMDLRQATGEAELLVGAYGMDEEFGLRVARDSDMSEVTRAVHRILGEQMRRTLEQLTTHRQLLDAVAEALVERERLTTQDLQAILPPLTGTPDPSIGS